ncbi:respiratory chain complex I subunit 1 family protein [Clostridium sp. DJ247]|uniref:respiratory chain complex I subunit 1 family protein n=1 Tax=Clostridium sp. DJ247 TaxID=2726188 RepID=UPI001628AB9F|nr:NADH-quinone oxidoreductase subunit H [Clostridium sp. DJ247]MBC2578737.1 hydrogenase [Clostridium sp. DJ247]
MVMNFIQSLLLIAAAPLFIGILKRMKAIIRGYEGAPICQPYYNIKRLLSKERVISKTSSFITTIGPTIILAAAVLSAFLVPIIWTRPKALVGNIFIVIFIMNIIKFITALIGLDCASTFGGMGSSRELFISMFAEPIGFLMAAFLYFETRTFNIYEIASINSLSKNLSTPHIIAAAAFLIWVAVENARMPVDNPETHLELTMIHEAMILDISGRDLAYIELASYIKLIVFLTIFTNAFIPFGIATSLTFIAIVKAAALYVIKVIAILFIIAIVETTMAKFRLFKVPELLAVSFCFALTAISIIYLN